MAPNILLFLSDDHAQWAAGCYGDGELQTPTLDTLAGAGARMQNAFTPTPVCSPARATLLTGRLPSQHGIHDWLRESEQAIGNRNWLASEATLAQILSARGRYHAGLSGKWHCGRSHHIQPGFRSWFSTDRKQGEHRGRNRYRAQSKLVTLEGFATQIITQRAINYLRKRDKSRPFFLLVGYIAPHSPWRGHNSRFVRQYRQATFANIPNDVPYPFGQPAGEAQLVDAAAQHEARAQYYAAISGIDHAVGLLLDELDHQGALEDTLIAYTSDHGLNAGHHGLWGKGNSTRPLNMLEESIRVPMILHHPRLIPPGQVRTEFVDHADLFQTLLDLAGANIPEDVRRARNYPGRSFRPLLAGDGDGAGWRHEQFGEYGNLRMVRTERYKLVRRYPNGPNHLFDLEQDPRETVDLFGDPGHQVLVGELTAAIDAYFSRYEAPARSGLRVKELPRHNNAEAWR